MHRRRSHSVSSHENTTGTIAGRPPVVIRAASAPAHCGYVGADRWRFGDGSPFCDAPAAPGSSYCERHRALCAIAPGSAAGRALAQALARAADSPGVPPPELAFLAAAAIPELEAEAERGDIAACVDLPPERGGAE